MSKLIALDDGHGMQTAGKRTPFIPEIGRFVHENEFNRAVVNYLNIELKRCGFKTLLVAPTDADTSLKARTDLANRMEADAYVSIHYDALDGKFDGEGKDPEGHTVFIYKGQRHKGSGKLAECVLKYLNEGTPQQNRGIKEADFAVLRNSNMIAILSENGFLDNKKEALWMVDPKFQKEVAVEHAKGICEYFGVEYKGEIVIQPKPVAQVSPIQIEWRIVKVISNQYGIYSEPATTWKEPTDKFVGWIFVVRQKQVINNQTWYHLYLGDNSYGWISAVLVEDVKYKWGVTKEDTVGYLHSDLKQVYGAIEQGSKIAIIDEQDDKFLVVSSNQPQYVPKNIVDL